ncbi:cohesin domain-containing protein [Chitinimonas naiadis]
MPSHSSFHFPLKPLCALALLALSGCAAGYHHRSGLEYMDKGAYAEAVQELQQAAELEPQDVRFRTDWLKNRETATRRLLAAADTAYQAGKQDEAEQHYRTILKYERSNARAEAGLEKITRTRLATEEATKAREALTLGDTVTAMKLVGRALDNMPDQPEAKAVRREIEALQAKDMLTAPTLGTLYKKPINLEFRDASIKMVFEALSRTTGINFIFDREVKSDQRTTVFLRQTTLEDAIDVILTTNQLDKKILNASSVLIYPNSGNKTKEYQDLVVRAFYLGSAEAKQTASMLKTVLKLKDVFVDDKLNMLILREPPETITLAEKLIALHDLDEPEVMLEVEVLEVNRSRLLDLGIKVTDQLTVTPLGGTASGGSDSAGSSSIRLSDLKHLNADKLGITLPSATVSFRKEDGDANLLANPRIRVRDREKAKILIGDKVPVVTTTTTPNGFLSENIQYLDVGLKLDVEPDVHVRDEIGLKIALEVSSLVSTVKTNNGSQAYQIGTRTASSVLRLKDGETQVLAGLISDEDRSAANRIPLLGDLPMLGRLFSSQKDDRKKTEIVLSITPRLIRNIQRKEPAAESFWSGTEASLRTKPLQLRSIESVPATSKTNAVNTSAPASSGPVAKPAPAAATGGIKLNWQGPNQAKVGEPITLELRLDSVETLRAAPIQFAYNPAMFEVVAVKEGDYFSKAGKANFTQLIDKPSGRVSIGLASGESTGAKGEGRLFSVELKPLQVQPEAEISLVAMTPVGSQQAVARPNLPIAHKINIVQ